MTKNEGIAMVVLLHILPFVVIAFIWLIGIAGGSFLLLVEKLCKGTKYELPEFDEEEE